MLRTETTPCDKFRISIHDDRTTTKLRMSLLNHRTLAGLGIDGPMMRFVIGWALSLQLEQAGSCRTVHRGWAGLRRTTECGLRVREGGRKTSIYKRNPTAATSQLNQMCRSASSLTIAKDQLSLHGSKQSSYRLEWLYCLQTNTSKGHHWSEPARCPGSVRHRTARPASSRVDRTMENPRKRSS